MAVKSNQDQVFITSKRSHVTHVVYYKCYGVYDRVWWKIQNVMFYLTKILTIANARSTFMTLD